MSDSTMVSLMAELRAQPSIVECPGGAKQAIERAHPNLTSRIRFESGEFAMPARHRRIDGRDFFWLVNNGAKRQSCQILFRGVQGEASIWDCESGAIRTVKAEQDADGSHVRLRFEPYQAYWVVFDPSRKATTAQCTDEVGWNEIAVPGPWTVQIDRSAQPELPKGFSSARPSLVTDVSHSPQVLQPWQAWGLDEFTGFVDYQTTFECRGRYEQFELDLGDVRHMAEVWVNGQAVGKRLWAPFRYDVASVIRPGTTNTLRVRVGNLFCNAMRPLEDRKEVFTGWAYSKSTPEQRTSGLLGPVRILAR